SPRRLSVNFLKSMALGIVCFVLGAAATRYYDSRKPAVAKPVKTAKTPANEAAAVVINFEQEPLWAYGFDRPPKPGEKANPQNPPNRTLRTNEDAGEQTRLRRLEGSKATYSLVDIRDGQNVIDWFPNDHPMPMPNVVVHGPTALGKATRGCGSCHLPEGKGSTGEARRGGARPT